MATRFVHIDDDQFEELCPKTHSKNTKRVTDTGVKLLSDFAAELKIENLELPIHDLDKLLVKFYAGARTKKGEYYKLNSFRGIRFSLQRYFLKRLNVDIISSDEFQAANTCFENISKLIAKSGKGSTIHHPEIEPEDLEKMYQSLSIETPTGLQEKVWLDVMIYLIRRGRENLMQMTKHTFCVGIDAAGKKFICQNSSEQDKNHDGIHDDGFDTTGEGRMYETGDSLCPVNTFTTYLSHLHPGEDSLWQRPLEKISYNSQVWYYRAPVGEKYLGGMMSKISSKYHLSQRYTNHSLRVTSMQILDDNNVESRHIVRVSGHKNTESIKSYARRLSAARKRSISQIISNNLGKQKRGNLQLLPESVFHEPKQNISPSN